MGEKILIGNDIKIVMCGTHEVGLFYIEKLINAGIKFSYFVLVDKETASKNDISGYVDYKPIAEKNNIPVYYVEKYSLKSERDQKFFAEHNFDLLIQGGWQRLFPDEILETLKIGAIGVHGSSDYLPLGRGRSPINWSIIEGRKRFILHYFLMKPGIDDGDIFETVSFDINEWDDCETIYLKNSISTFDVLLKNVPKLLNQDIIFVKQAGQPTYYPKRTKEDGKLDFTKDIFELHNFIRALTKPYPGAFAFVEDEKITIWKAQPFDTKIDKLGTKIGEVIYTDSKRAIIKCKGGLLLLTDYEISNLTKLKTGQIIS